MNAHARTKPSLWRRYLAVLTGAPRPRRCGCTCHTLCSCDLGLSLGAWQCRQHEDAHCGECRP